MTRSPFKLSLLALALLSCATSSWSMDLLQAYEAAKANDASIRASRAAADMGRERLPQARSQLLPSLTASVGTNRNQLSSGVPNSLGQIQSSDTDYPSSNRTVSLRQPLFRAYQMAQYRQAQAQVDDTEASLAQEEQDLAVRVSGAYFEAMLTHEQLALVLAQRASYSTQLAAAKQALVGGSGTRTDVDEAQARLDMTVASEIEARQSIDYTLRQLQTLVNQPINGLSRLDLSRFTLADPQPNQVESWIEKLELNNRHLQSLKAQVEAARKEVDKAQSGHTPTLDAVVQWSRSQSENVLNVQSSYTNKAIGLQLNVPIYSGGYVNSTVRQALAGVERAEQLLEGGRRDLAVSVHKEFRGVTENMARIRALEQALRSADQLVLSNRKSLQAGSRTLMDVMNAEQQRMLTLRDLAQARFMYLISKVRLLALTGGADADAIAGINQVLKP
jgi:TolC family type I secretion outer membrane protein